MTVVNPYARSNKNKQETPAAATSSKSKNNSIMRNKPVMVTQDGKKSKPKQQPGAAAAAAIARPRLPLPLPLPLSKKSKENVHPPPSVSNNSNSNSNGAPLLPVPVTASGSAAAGPFVGGGGVARGVVPTIVPAPNNLAPKKKLTLKQELAALKQQQKLQKERLALQKEQKKQRKLWKKQQQQQQQQQRNEEPSAAPLLEHETVGGSGTARLPNSVEKLLQAAPPQQQPQPQPTSPAALSPLGNDDGDDDHTLFASTTASGSSNLSFPDALDDSSKGHHHQKKESFSSSTSDYLMNSGSCEPIAFFQQQHQQPSNAVVRMTAPPPQQEQASNNYEQPYAAQYYYNNNSTSPSTNHFYATQQQPHQTSSLLYYHPQAAAAATATATVDPSSSLYHHHQPQYPWVMQSEQQPSSSYYPHPHHPAESYYFYQQHQQNPYLTAGTPYAPWTQQPAPPYYHPHYHHHQHQQQHLPYSNNAPPARPPLTTTQPTPKAAPKDLLPAPEVKNEAKSEESSTIDNNNNNNNDETDAPAETTNTTTKDEPLPSLSAKERKRLETRQTMLSLYPLFAPSPFAETHEILTQPVRLIRRAATEPGYGVVLKLDSSQTVVGGHPVGYCVLSVLECKVQNERLLREHSNNSDGVSFLEKDDIILSIHGHSTAGLSFASACELFKKFSRPWSTTDASICCCDVTVARRRVKPLPSNSINNTKSQPLLANTLPTATPAPTGPLSPAEQLALAESALQALYDRPLGTLGGTPGQWLIARGASHPLSARGVAALDAAWRDTESASSQAVSRAAQTHWAAVADETNPSGGGGALTDAQRSRLRLQPRPAESCRCGSADHFYVNDAKCPLYSNLRALLLDKDTADDDDAAASGADKESSLPDAAALEEAAAKRKKLLDKNFQKDTLNVVEKAYKDRFVRIKTEQEFEQAEMTFVERMEALQLSTCNQAVFAPSLTAMVLSAVAELEAEFQGKELGPMSSVVSVIAKTETRTEAVVNSSSSNPTAKLESAPEIGKDNTESKHDNVSLTALENKSHDEGDGEESSDDEDDDIPLADLGKKKRSKDAVVLNEQEPTSVKKQRGDNTIMVRPQFVARLIQFISAKWGHVYREPSNAEYSWRWELYHGSIEEGKWDAGNNPRTPGSLSLENYRFYFTSQTIENLETADNALQNVEAIKCLADAASPKRTGVLDELLALVRTEILSIDDRGIPTLTKDWWSKVDFLLLSEMDECFGVPADPSGKFGVAEKIRSKLDREWTKTARGFAFASDPNDTIYDDNEFTTWRMAYEEKQQSRSEGAAGVHRFN